MGYSFWLCGFVSYSDEGYAVMSKKTCPGCGVSSAFVPLSDESQIHGEAKDAIDRLYKETRGLFTRRKPSS